MARPDKSRIVRKSVPFANDPTPLRAELFSTSQMMAHCKMLANRSGVVNGYVSANLQNRLADNEKVLLKTKELLISAHRSNAGSIKDQEWMQTNFFVIQEQVQKVRSLMIQLDNILPLLETGPLKGRPRIYEIAAEIVSHSNSQIELEQVVTFIAAYQQEAALRVGELKAVRVMLKFVLIENLRRLAVRMAAPADHAEDKLRSHKKEQLTDRAAFRNCISSLRILDTIDWDEFLDVTSLVEQILGKEQSGVYPEMDFYTRDHYRNEVGAIAKYTGLPELEVARRTVALADNAASMNDLTAHVGFFLIGKGRKKLEAALDMSSSGVPLLKRLLRRYPALFYLGGILATTLIVSVGLFVQTYEPGMGWGLSVILAVLLLLSAGQLGVMFIDWLVMLASKPSLVPRMDYSGGIPSAHRTLVVIPALLTKKAEIEELLSGLEVRFLANRDAHVHFGLLTDFGDAQQEVLPTDAALLHAVKTGIEKLNLRYGSTGHHIFFLFHRPRRWNMAEQVWMGYERKRGKLMELNGLLRGEGAENFSHIVGDSSVFPLIKYIITLDSDTQLPRNAAWEMIAAMAHPLNRAVYDEEKGRVVAGYGILQPRIGINMLGKAGSFYQHLTAGVPDMDPYTRAAADVYQDMFGEGSFIGKGIYDVDVFIKALGKRLPENRILSHDLLEGSYTRSGLLTDVKLYEDSSDFWADLKRRHRWVRGDWQIAAWVGPFVPGPQKKKVRNPISILSRWRIFDNLRSSLMPGTLILLLILGWTVLPAPWRWTLLVILIMIFPALKIFAGKMVEKPSGLLSWRYWKISAEESFFKFVLNVYDLVCLPYQAFYTIDAILLAWWRTFITRKKLLEWVPFGSSTHSKPENYAAVYAYLWTGPVLSILLIISLAVFHPGALLVAAPVLIGWLLSPVVAWKFNQPSTTIKAGITSSQHIFLRKMARKTWTYFENFINEDSNWLPPDHYREYPSEKLATYTSPTNMGLALLANLSASDFGYITAGKFVENISHTMHTLGRLERYQGHFYNWYDNITLAPAVPRYVSTVDSGNLAGHLLTLQQGVLGLPNEKIFGSQLFNGLNDTLELVIAETEKSALLHQCSIQLNTIIKENANSLTNIKRNIGELSACAAEIALSLPPATGKDALYWLQLFNKQCDDITAELSLLSPWLWLAPAPARYAGLIPGNIPTLNELSEMTIETLLKKQPPLTDDITAAEKEWLDQAQQCIAAAAGVARERIVSIENISAQCAEFAEMEYEFLYNKSQQLLSIGYQVEEECMDANCYDVLASEARMAAFIAIGQGKLPKKSWFVARRLLLETNGSYILLSANGTMFEYLMPLLVMPAYENTLLHHGNKAAVEEQIRYGKAHGIPWGISESAYSTMDADLNYQYKVFGVPALGLKRGGETEDRVIAPYASALALMVDPGEACSNLQELSNQGFEGRYGYYEAIDYMPSRLLHGQSNVVVRSFMAHHQGMSLLAMAYLLLDQPMQKRFESSPQLKSSLLLLQERIPKDTALHLQEITIPDPATEMIDTPLIEKVEATAEAIETPEVQLLSNGRYHVMVTSTGNGYSQWEDMAITRWQDDNPLSCGMFCYIQDMEDDAPWSVTYQPAHRSHGTYKTTFSPGMAVFHHRHKELETELRLIVAPEEDIELRQLTIHNFSGKHKSIEVTSYVEVMLMPLEKNESALPENDLSPEKEVLPDLHAVLCNRPAGIAGGRLPWMFQVMKVSGAVITAVTYETDNLLFSDAMPVEVMPKEKTVITIRYRITIAPGEQATADIYSGIGEHKKSVEALVHKCQDQYWPARLFNSVHKHHQVILKQIRASYADAALFRRVAGPVIFNDLALKAETMEYNIPNIIGPLIILRIHNTADIEVVEQFIQMQAYWRLNGLITSLMIWNEDDSCYRHFLQRLILESITSGIGSEMLYRNNGGILIRAIDKRSDEDDALLQRASCVITAGKWHPSAGLTILRTHYKEGFYPVEENNR
jgi:cyclic beta-1,2-glucan synthetase